MLADRHPITALFLSIPTLSDSFGNALHAKIFLPMAQQGLIGRIGGYFFAPSLLKA